MSTFCSPSTKASDSGPTRWQHGSFTYLIMQLQDGRYQQVDVVYEFEYKVHSSSACSDNCTQVARTLNVLDKKGKVIYKN